MRRGVGWETRVSLMHVHPKECSPLCGAQGLRGESLAANCVPGRSYLNLVFCMSPAPGVESLSLEAQRPNHRCKGCRKSNVLAAHVAKSNRKKSF